MSRWITPLLWHAITVSTTCRKKLRATFSSSIPFSVMKSNRSLQGSGLSMTMMKESWLSKQSSSLTTWGTPHTFRKRQTSNGTDLPFIWNKLRKIRLKILFFFPPWKQDFGIYSPHFFPALFFGTFWSPSKFMDHSNAGNFANSPSSPAPLPPKKTV